LLPFDDSVCAGQRGARARSLAYVWHQTLAFAKLLIDEPLSRATYARFVEPWGLQELVEGCIYRSAEPRALHLEHLHKLGIRTLVCVKRTLPHPRTIEHALEHGLFVARIDLGADGDIDPRAVQRTLEVITRPELWPVLLHCDGGRHRTGIVAAALRRSQGFSLERALEEYERYAAPTPRETDREAVARYFAYAASLESER
jgi:protein tyrosine/serine phosphatase